jgi:hypothetical protein
LFYDNSGAETRERDTNTDDTLRLQEFKGKEKTDTPTDTDLDLDLSLFATSDFRQTYTDDQLACEIVLGDTLKTRHGGQQTPKAKEEALYDKGKIDKVYDSILTRCRSFNS